MLHEKHAWCSLSTCGGYDQLNSVIHGQNSAQIKSATVLQHFEIRTNLSLEMQFEDSHSSTVETTSLLC